MGGSHFDPSIEEFIHADFITGSHARVLQEVLTEGHLTFRGDGQSGHRGMALELWDFM